MSFVWHNFFYDPLLNALVFLYNGPARQNLGLALIELTVIIRLCLLPFTVISLKARRRFEELNEKIDNLETTYKGDPDRRRKTIRDLLKKNHINPWAKATMFFIQFLALVVIYKVFVDAVRNNNFTGLYIWNRAPDFLNRMFLGFDLSARDIFWPALVAAILYLDVWMEQHRHSGALTNGDVIYRAGFAVAFAMILYALPSGKSVFVLTSILFSLMVDGVYKMFVRKKNVEEPA